MTKQEFIKEMEENWQGFDYLTITLTEGDEYTIAESDYWVGGIEGCWGCDILANVAYPSFEDVVYRVACYVYDELKDKVIEINC